MSYSEATAIQRTEDLAKDGGRWPSDWVEAYKRGFEDAIPPDGNKSNDGDAFRLAVRLGLFGNNRSTHAVFQRLYLEELNKDLRPSEAARSAITRTAAEIGRISP